MIKITGSLSKGMMARFVGAVFDDRYYFEPGTRQAIDLECNRIASESFSDLDLFYTESNLGRVEYYDPQQVIVGGIQPNMIVGMLLGAELVPNAEADADITEKCLAKTDWGDLPAPDSLVSHPLIEQFTEQSKAILDDVGTGLSPIPPFFWDKSGRAAVHGSVTSAVKLVGDEFFLGMLSNPSECRRLIDWLTDVSIVLVQHFSKVGQFPVTGIHIGECVACMVDVKNYRDFMLDAASRLGRALGPVRFHSCGRSDHLIEEFAKIERLESLDVGGETSIGAIRKVFGKDLPVSVAPLVEDMSANDPTRILDWFMRVKEENQGGDLTIGYHLEADYNLDTIRALHEAVQSA